MVTPRLLGSTRPLSQLYDVALLDLDGVVYLGDQVVPAAPGALAGARRDGMRLAFVTNNASRPPDVVAQRLTRMGVPADPAEVTTSAQAAAHHLADVLEPGATVLVVGGAGLHAALAERGLVATVAAVDPSTGRPVAAVVQGFDPSVGWAVLAEAAVAIRSGARWVATNLDRTVPSERGPLPGNGALVHTLAFALDVEPESTGKPDPTMHRESVERSGAQAPIVVGDRLDTDIEGAVRAGAPSLLVLSGISGPRDVVSAQSGRRPDYLARDVDGLLLPHPGVDWSGAPGPSDVDRPAGNGAAGRERGVGAWVAAVDDGGITLRHCREPDAPDVDRGLDALRTVAPAAWWCADHGLPVRIRAAEGDDAAAAVLTEWGIRDGERIRTST